ncbi:hypothetical protein BD309DRAFT_963495 [Dichomitus squalens]|nr:hypothetical protein BD309DRAFT_963495 [Dichomitus squalens]
MWAVIACVRCESLCCLYTLLKGATSSREHKYKARAAICGLMNRTHAPHCPGSQPPSPPRELGMATHRAQ